MDISIDQGNSSTKVGIFNSNVLIKTFTIPVFGIDEVTFIFEEYAIDACILSSVIIENETLIELLKSKSKYLIILSQSTHIPIKNNYKTPETLGKDRIAAVVGASFLKPDTDILVIDAGTAITYDFITAKKVYKGGNIAPGLNLRLRSLHEFTQKLPLVEATINSPLLGNSTETALISGALYGIVFEIDGYINTLKIKYPQLSIFLTGGSTFYFDNKLKSPIFVEKNLVLIGLNRILQYNVQ
ncbi:MAG: type III pantothenate kinase [Paludibacter sp.]